MGGNLVNHFVPQLYKVSIQNYFCITFTVMESELKCVLVVGFLKKGVGGGG